MLIFPGIVVLFLIGLEELSLRGREIDIVKVLLGLECVHKFDYESSLILSIKGLLPQNGIIWLGI